MRTVNNMGAKDIRVAINRGTKVEDLLTKYNCTEDEFDKRLSVVFKHEAAKMKQKLVSASKKKNRGSSRAETAPIAVIEADETAISEPEDIMPTTEEIPHDDLTAVETIEDLKAREDSLSADIVVLEAKKNIVDSKLSANQREATALKSKVDSLLERIREYEDELAEITAQRSEYDSQIGEIEGEISDKRAQLDDVRARILEKSRVRITVYNDGRMVFFDDERPITFDDKTGLPETTMRLLGSPLLESVTVNGLKLIARAFCIMKNTPDERFEFIFDDNKLDKAFNSLF